MTVTYSESSLFKLLFRWHGSVWKAIWKELLIWLLLFYAIRTVIMYAFSESTKREYIDPFIQHFYTFTVEFPVEFGLGFYVSQVITRWWSQVLVVPWPEDLVSLFSAHINGSDTKSATIRYNAGRYLLITEILVLRDLSKRVRKRFPTFRHLMHANLMSKQELELLERGCAKNPWFHWQMPLCWFRRLVRIGNSSSGERLFAVSEVAILQELNKFRSSLRSLLVYNTVQFPILYTQATALGLYSYFAMALIGEQTHENKAVEMYAPYTTILEFVFYVGWYKIAQDFTRPFGEGDDNMEVNYTIDQHWKLVQALARVSDPMRFPILAEPEVQVTQLPHTKMSAELDDIPPKLCSHFKAKEDWLQFDTEMTDDPNQSADICYF